MTNKEQRTKIEKLLNEIEESATDLTAEEQEALLVVKSITGIAFDLSDNLEANPTETLEKMFDDLEALDYQRAILRSQNLPSGGIVAEVNRGGEVAISEKMKHALAMTANEKAYRDYLELKGVKNDNEGQEP